MDMGESADIINLSLTLLRTKKYSQWFLPHKKSKNIYFSIMLYQFYHINTINNTKTPVQRWAQPTQAMLAGSHIDSRIEVRTRS